MNFPHHGQNYKNMTFYVSMIAPRDEIHQGWNSDILAIFQQNALQEEEAVNGGR